MSLNLVKTENHPPIRSTVPTVSTALATPSRTPPSISPKAKQGLGIGAKIGVAFGVIVLVIALLAALVIGKRKRKSKKAWPNLKLPELDSEGPSTWKAFLGGAWRSEKDGAEKARKELTSQGSLFELDGNGVVRSEAVPARQPYINPERPNGAPEVTENTPITPVEAEDLIQARGQPNNSQAAIGRSNPSGSQTATGSTPTTVGDTNPVAFNAKENTRKAVKPATVSSSTEGAPTTAEDVELKWLEEEAKRIEERRQGILQKKRLDGQ